MRGNVRLGVVLGTARIRVYEACHEGDVVASRRLKVRGAFLVGMGPSAHARSVVRVEWQAWVYCPYVNAYQCRGTGVRTYRDYHFRYRRGEFNERRMEYLCVGVLSKTTSDCR